MSTPGHDKQIDYIEFATSNIAETKRFFTEVFGWSFEDFGPDYTSFNDGRLSGGFYAAPVATGGNPLVVIYAAGL